MPQPLRFPYSLNSALLGVLMPLVFFGITYNNLLLSFQDHLVMALAIILFADLLFISYLVFVLIKRLIPALQNKTALELNDKGIVDGVRNILIEWSDVQGLSHEFGRNSSKIIVKLKHETEYGSEVVIRLRWVKGKDREIFGEAYAYFKKMMQLN